MFNAKVNALPGDEAMHIQFLLYTLQANSISFHLTGQRMSRIV